ncbi:unnamed protein product [Penicillium roqueforti FM164]|uniref:Genomic scaffold, ProqFM164S01 n=1 Tax=Penicillium roqueforti (strain FM164) TaxID=1365484 RepID=W6QG25_PENRF|nr:unnamed protein product [Penicillium roqueforti FM164]
MNTTYSVYEARTSRSVIPCFRIFSPPFLYLSLRSSSLAYTCLVKTHTVTQTIRCRV